MAYGTITMLEFSYLIYGEIATGTKRGWHVYATGQYDTAKERRVTGGANGCMRERMIRINNEG